ncbi:hypothetical protein GCK72_000369 [Caenorhabditis remanei]|uniref:Uncharacterized protein n=1 Tax=Caenorhabditis remanei TaxID=31234 RepID=A0A6A5HQH1_CAERE|nr:hypothetical protein GCK72_000369 [Caenorhabditis remanei]KAF1768557.1 hypothetical protein GCK72_000369 [Caenorhabditis remanei]
MDSPPPPDPVARQPEQYWAIGPLVQVNVKTCLLDDDLTAWVTLDLEPFEPHEITVAMEEEEEESPGYILMDGRLHAATAPPWKALSGPRITTPSQPEPQFCEASTEAWKRRVSFDYLSCGCHPEYDKDYWYHDIPLVCITRQLGQAIAERIWNNLPIAGMRFSARI